MEFDRVIDKLKDILSSELGDKKVFDKDVAFSLGLSKENLSHLKKRGSIPFEQIAIFCAKRKISINWVLFDQLPKSLEAETEKYVKIKYFSKINPSAGGGGYIEDESYEELYLDKNLLDSLYKSQISNPNTIIAFKIVGDSMEPTLHDNQIVLADTTIQDHNQKDGIFIISTKEGLFAKRINYSKNQMTLLSDNTQYDPITLDQEEGSVTIVGKVLGKITLE